jgi:hypothetical protein
MTRSALLGIGGLYVSSVGRVTAYSEFTGTRFRHSVTILRGPVARGENNDLVLGRDGRFVMGITASCDHCAPRSKWPGSIVSFRPDGSDLRLYAARIRAPVGLAFCRRARVRPDSDRAAERGPGSRRCPADGDVQAPYRMTPVCPVE